jgi:hypothetical protein
MRKELHKTIEQTLIKPITTSKLMFYTGILGRTLMEVVLSMK